MGDPFSPLRSEHRLELNMIRRGNCWDSTRFHSAPLSFIPLVGICAQPTFAACDPLTALAVIPKVNAALVSARLRGSRSSTPSPFRLALTKPPKLCEPAEYVLETWIDPPQVPHGSRRFALVCLMIRVPLTNNI